MKWPKSLTIVRHAQSAYNALRIKKEMDPEYRVFKMAFARDHYSDETRSLAEKMREKYALNTSDYDTPITEEGADTAYKTGRRLHELMEIPDVILVSPYLRTRQTLEQLKDGWSALEYAETVEEDRIREQEHGLSLLYSDWRIFQTYHPEQKELHDLLGPYWYQYPQGEAVSHVRDRVRQVQSMLIREYAGKNVMMVSHHLTKLSARANIERLTPEEFIRLDNEEKPKNCGVTHYVGKPDLGKNGKLILEFYNKTLY